MTHIVTNAYIFKPVCKLCTVISFKSIWVCVYLLVLHQHGILTYQYSNKLVWLNPIIKYIADPNDPKALKSLCNLLYHKIHLDTTWKISHK